MKLKKGDQIKIVSGKDSGKTGKIEKVLPRRGMILVPGLNVVKKHLKARGEGKPGGIVEVVKPLLACKVALICPKCNQRTRIGFKLGKGKEKHRICRKCQQII